MLTCGREEEGARKGPIQSKSFVVHRDGRGLQYHCQVHHRLPLPSLQCIAPVEGGVGFNGNQSDRGSADSLVVVDKRLQRTFAKEANICSSRRKKVVEHDPRYLPLQSVLLLKGLVTTFPVFSAILGLPTTSLDPRVQERSKKEN